MITPTIETRRMILRPLCVEDAPVIYERWTSDDRVTKYLRYTTHQSVEDTIHWLREEEKANLGEDSYQWGLVDKEKNYLFGSGGFLRDASGTFKLGYNIMYDYWNQGYTTEAVQGMLKFAHEEMHQQEIIAWYVKDNLASGAVLKKCGFLYEKECMRKLKTFAETHSVMPAYIGSIGMFNDTQTIFVSPIMNSAMYQFQRELYEMFNCFDAKGWEWYCPDRWVPHCTIALTGEDGEYAFFGQVTCCFTNLKN